MATIQVADKPTLDRVEALLRGSGGVSGYPNVSLTPIAKGASVRISGKGMALIPGWSSIRIKGLDNFELDLVCSGSSMSSPCNVYFNKNITIANTGSGDAAMIAYLEN